MLMVPLLWILQLVLKSMLKHPLTDTGIERFLEDSRSYEKESARERSGS